jgi:hypothetical protein
VGKHLADSRTTSTNREAHRRCPMTIVTEYDWQSDTFTHHGENGARAAWREAVAEIAAKAKATLPDCAGRVDRAVQIVLNHDAGSTCEAYRALRQDAVLGGDRGRWVAHLPLCLPQGHPRGGTASDRSLTRPSRSAAGPGGFVRAWQVRGGASAVVRTPLRAWRRSPPPHRP